LPQDNKSPITSFELNPQPGYPYVVLEPDGILRLDPLPADVPYKSRETWDGMFPVTPGQVVAARALIKTGSVPPDYVPPEPWSNGARIGVDFYAADKKTILRTCELVGIDGYGPYVGEGWVPWGSPWTYRELYIPAINTETGKDTVVREGEAYVLMWLQCMAYDAPASAWYRNTEFYILNPGETPPTPIPPTLVSPLFPNLREILLSRVPSLARVYGIVDGIRAKRQEYIKISWRG